MFCLRRLAPEGKVGGERAVDAAASALAQQNSSASLVPPTPPLLGSPLSTFNLRTALASAASLVDYAQFVQLVELPYLEGCCGGDDDPSSAWLATCVIAVGVLHVFLWFLWFCLNASVHLPYSGIDRHSITAHATCGDTSFIHFHQNLLACD